MPDLVRIVIDLAAVFDALQLRFALGGALATNYWGVVRTTQDVDCLIALPTLKYQLLADELQAIGCRQQVESGELADISAVRMHNQAQVQKFIECIRDSIRIELFVPVVPLQDEVLRRAVMMPLGGRQVPITTAEDLILLKLAFHRPKDVQDVRGILWVQGDKLDFDYLRRWSANTLHKAVQQELEQLIVEYGNRE